MISGSPEMWYSHCVLALPGRVLRPAQRVLLLWRSSYLSLYNSGSFPATMVLN